MPLSQPNLKSLQQKLEAALALYRAGQIGEAARIYRAVVEVAPEQPDALHMLGIIAQHAGKSELALQLFDETLRIVPHFAQGWANRAVILRLLKRKEEALHSAEKAIACDPHLADGWDIGALSLQDQRELAKACDYHSRAIALKPDNANFLNNYAIALSMRGQLEEAYKIARRAVEQQPALAIAHLTLGHIIGAAGYPARAIPHYQKARLLNPTLADAASSEGRSHMAMGDFAQGWALMEARFAGDARFENLPRWQGEKIHHLLLYGEQGIGDVIHFLRYISLIKNRTGKITLQAEAPLHRLLKANLPDIALITPHDPLPQADAYQLLLSLPYLLKTTADAIPADIPYLQAEENWRSPWPLRLAGTKKPRIGVVWAGNPNYVNDLARSMTIEQIAPLWRGAEVNFVSLQKGATPAGIFNAMSWLDDFAATAGLIAELDLIISVDTAVAHLAGAMGKPVWILLPFGNDWRWLMGREDSPWYPTMRLFRQQRPQDWGSVAERVVRDLQKFIAGDQSVLAPPRWTGGNLHEHPKAVKLPGL